MKKIIALALSALILFYSLAGCAPLKNTPVSGSQTIFGDDYKHTECSNGKAHSFTSTVTASTCTKRGYTTNVCNNCGYTYLSETENAKGHNWSGPDITKNVTCTEDGLQVFKCTACNETKEENLTRSGHNYLPLEENDSFNFVISDPDMEIPLPEDDGLITFVCEFCNDSVTLKDGEELPEPTEEVKILMGQEKDFSFLVSCDRDAEYVLSNLSVNNYFTELKADIVISEENGAYRISPKDSYMEYGIYKVNVSDDISFTEYNAKTIQFEIKGPDKTHIVYNSDNIVFLKALEQSDKGYYPYEIKEDQAANKQYLTLSKTGKLDSSYLGKVICVGDYLNTEELLEDITKDIYLGKIESIYRNDEGKTEVELSTPDISDVFDELNVYSNSGLSNENITLNENLEQEFLSSVMESDGFINYTAALDLAAKDYADDMGIVAVSLVEELAKGKFSFELTKDDIKKISDNKLKTDIEGTLTYTIPLKTAESKGVGNITVKCIAGADITLDFSGHFKKDLSAHLGVVTDTNTHLSFELKFNLEQSLSNEIRYYVNNKTQKIHTGTCRIATKGTDVKNLSIYRASELLDLYNGDRNLMKSLECGICKAVTGLDGSCYVLNSDTNTLHCLNCRHVKNIDKNNLYEIYPKTVAGFENCKDCKPEERQGLDFENRIQNAMAGSDWGEQINNLRESLKKSDTEEKTTERGTSIGYLPFSLMGVFNVNFEIALVFDFSFEATVKASYSSGSIVQFGVFISPKEYRPYCEKTKKTPSHEFEATGKISTEFGFLFSAEANLITDKLACIRFSAEVGVYCDVSGILHSESKNNIQNSFFAARLETGLYYLVTGYWRILGWDDEFSIAPKTKIPCMERGYKRAYYTFDEYNQKIVIKPTDMTFISLYNAECMKAKYIDLTTLSSGTSYLNPCDNNNYKIEYTFSYEDSTADNYLTVDNGILKLTDAAPEKFTAEMQIKIIPKQPAISSLTDFFAYQFTHKAYGYFLEPTTVQIIVDSEGDESTVNNKNNPLSLDDMPLIAHDSYKDNEGDSTIFNLNGKGLTQCDDGETFNRNGNVGIDGTKHSDGFEVWIARWNYTDEISWASATFYLGGNFKKLSGKTNLISSYNTTNFDTTIYFYDGDKLLASYTLTDSDYIKDISVDVTDVKQLKLYVKDNISASGGTSFALYDMFLDSETKQSSDKAVNKNIPEDATAYNGHYYKIYSEVCSSWEEAKEYCENLGGYLAVISSPEENEALFSYIISQGHESVYFGYSDTSEENNWVWVSGEDSTFENWASGEPNNESSNENYAMFYYKYTDGTWNDGNFGKGTVSDSLTFICEWSK